MTYVKETDENNIYIYIDTVVGRLMKIDSEDIQDRNSVYKIATELCLPMSRARSFVCINNNCIK